MTTSDTSETDAELYPMNGVDIVWPDFARKLERERDEALMDRANGDIATMTRNHYERVLRERNEARKELAEYRSIAENIGAKKAVSEKEKAIRERDEWAAMCGRYKQERDDLQKAINGLCEHFKISPANTTLLAVEVLRIQREREEAITRRIETIMQCELYEQERDEARNESQRLRLDAQKEAEHHDRMVKELEGLYDKLKS